MRICNPYASTKLENSKFLTELRIMFTAWKNNVKTSLFNNFCCILNIRAISDMKHGLQIRI